MVLKGGSSTPDNVDTIEFWVSKDGRITAIEDLSWTHLRNIIKLFHNNGLSFSYVTFAGNKITVGLGEYRVMLQELDRRQINYAKELLKEYRDTVQELDRRTAN